VKADVYDRLIPRIRNLTARLNEDLDSLYHRDESTLWTWCSEQTDERKVHVLHGSILLSKEPYVITNSVALVRERTIPTERPPLVGEVSANLVDRRVSHGQCGGFPTAVISVL
jgi:hypothetical protein